MGLRVYNYLVRELVEFQPLEEGCVTMYVCGPTVYDHAHLGHAKLYVAMDVVVRYLRFLGYRVRYVPGAVARHLGGHAVGKVDELSRAEWWYGSLLRYSFKHFRRGARLVVWKAVVLGCGFRMVYAILRGWTLAPLAVYGRVIRFACLRLWAGRNGEAGKTPVLARQ